jgi:hypothetical protein
MRHQTTHPPLGIADAIRRLALGALIYLRLKHIGSGRGVLLECRNHLATLAA